MTAQAAAKPRKAASKASRSASAETPSPAAMQGKQAVVVIHGMGEQRPLDTLREFVETVYQRDPGSKARVTVPEMPGPNDGKLEASKEAKGKDGMNPISIVPDATTGSAELRRITTHPAQGRRTDFFEFYWADIMDGTPLELVTSWVSDLLLRSPFRVPMRIQMWIAWLALWLLAAFLVVLGMFVIYPGGFEADPFITGAMDWLAALKGQITAVALIIAFALAAFSLATTRPLSEANLKPAVVLLVMAAVVWFLPEGLAIDPRVWATLLWVAVGWLFAKLVGPYFGDVVRYVRATPQTVEKRKQVRERGLALLTGLHEVKDVSGLPYYDRIVIVGHSLGSIIAYDLLQHYWEQAGPTHHLEVDGSDGKQRWSPSPDAGAAMRTVDGFVQTTWAGGAVDIPKFEHEHLEDFRQAQGALCDVLRAETGWRITDLITLGSPLVHAEFLMVDGRQELAEAFLERRISSSPPRPDPVRGEGSMLYDDKTASGARRGPFIHFAAPFAAVRWTNLFDEHWFPLLGDIVSGALRRDFGPGIAERRVRITRKGWLPILDRFFTHTRYWSWHRSYDPAKPPEHIRLLREALDISGKS
jgi:hypothetical protein